MRLLRVELTRLRWRRAVLVLLTACLVVPALIFATTAWSTRPVSGAELARAQHEVTKMRDSQQFQHEIKQCERHPERFGTSNGQPLTAGDCATQLGPQVEWFLARSPLDVADLSRGLGPTVTVLLAGLLMLLGTTFAGADWNSGSMSNQLLFEPRRLRVWAAKATAVLLTAAVTSAVVLAGFWSAVLRLASVRDIRTSPHVTSFIRDESLRGIALAAAAALGAFALTMLFRSTVATLGILFAVTLVGSLILAALGISERWFPHANVGAWLLDGFNYYVTPPSSCQATNQMTAECRGLRTVTMGEATGYLGTLLVVGVAASAWSFRRRDVP